MQDRQNEFRAMPTSCHDNDSSLRCDDELSVVYKVMDLTVGNQWPSLWMQVISKGCEGFAPVADVLQFDR
jgi:hypothetical protein